MPLPSLNRSLFRRIKYIAGRILQANELEVLQNLERNASQRGMGSLYRPGATLNTSVQITGNQVALTPKVQSQPMMVFINGTFESFTAGAFSFTTKSPGTRDFLYLNYTVWRVTQDGSQGATIADATLTDSQTGESVAEMGQLEITISQSSTHGAVDASQMLDRNTTPIILFAFEWQQGGVLTQMGPTTGSTSVTNPITAAVERIDPVLAQAMADEKTAGFVLLSASGSNGVAVATTDPRLLSARDPNDNSIYTGKVKAPDASTASVVTYPGISGAATVSASLAGVQILDTNGGINADRIFLSRFSTKLSDSFSLAWDLIVSLLSTARSHNTRLNNLEGVSGGSTGHAGGNLGLVNTHPPVIDATLTDSEKSFRVLVADNIQDSANDLAYGAVLKQGSTVQGGVFQNGDYRLVRDTNSLQFGTGTNNVRNNTVVGSSPTGYFSFRTLARLIKDHLENHPAGGSGGGVTSLGGDVTGLATGNALANVKGIPVSGLPSSLAGLAGARLLVLSPESGGYGLAFDPTGASGTSMVVYDATNKVYSLAAVPSGAGAVTLGGDVTGSPTANTVAKIRGKDVSITGLDASFGGQFFAFNGSAFSPFPLAKPAAGQTLIYDPTLNTGKGGWTIGSAAAASVGASIPAGGSIKVRAITGANAGSGRAVSWTILKIGTTRIAFGSADLKDGDVIPSPGTTWNSANGTPGSMGYYQWSAGFTVLADMSTSNAGINWDQIQVYVDTGNYNNPEVVIRVKPWNSSADVRAKELPTADFYARVFITAIGNQPENEAV